MYYSDEQIQRANEQSISEYFQRQGYSCKPQRNGETHIEGFGGFYVKEETQEYYIHSQQKGGRGLVSCLMKVMDMPFKEAIREALNGEEGMGKSVRDGTRPAPVRPPKPEYKKPEFIKPEMSAENRKVFAYLTKTRKIPSDIVNAFLRSKVLYQDKKGNAVFLHVVNGQSCGAEIHGTSGKSYKIGNTPYNDISDKSVISTEPYIAEVIGRELENGCIKFAGYVYENNANIVVESRNFEILSDLVNEVAGLNLDREDIDREVNSKLKNYKGVAPGTTESYFQFNIGCPKRAFVFESSIDLMSYLALHPNVTDCKLVAMAGLKPNVVEKLLAENLSVALCVDNDEAGSRFCQQFAGRCTRSVECARAGVKDFNELLQNKQGVPVEQRISSVDEWVKNAAKKLSEQHIDLGFGNFDKWVEEMSQQFNYDMGAAR